MTRPAFTLLAAGIHKPLPERVASPDVGSIGRAHGAWEPELLRAERLARETMPAPSTFGTAPDASIPSSIDALTREQTRHAITRDALSGLVSALEAQAKAWRQTAATHDRSAEWAADSAALRAHARRGRICAADLEALIAGHTGTLPDDDDEVLADSPGEQSMPRVAGKPFRCECGCNVFTRRGDRYDCNGCAARYIGEPLADSPAPRREVAR